MQKYEIISDKFNINIIWKLKSSNNNEKAGSEVLTDVLLKIRVSEMSTVITSIQTGYAYETQNDTCGSW
jgi:hypothetical protein